MGSLFISGKITTLWQPFSLAACHCFSPYEAPSSRETFALSLVLLSQHILMFYMKVPYIEPFIIAHIQFYFYRELRGPCCRLAPSRSLFFSVSVFSPQNARLRLQKSIFWKFGNCEKPGELERDVERIKRILLPRRHRHGCRGKILNFFVTTLSKQLQFLSRISKQSFTGSYMLL